MANKAAGKGYENESFYANIKFQFMGIENIHVMRGSLQKLMEGEWQGATHGDLWPGVVGWRALPYQGLAHLCAWAQLTMHGDSVERTPPGGAYIWSPGRISAAPC